MVWVVFALMTAAVVLCLVWPLTGHRGLRRGPVADLDFYAAQLAEVDGDVERGLVTPAEVEGTRSEIGRRLLAASARLTGTAAKAVSPGSFRRRRLVAMLAALLVVPSLAMGLYIRIGHPEQPDQPITARNNGQSFDLAAAIPKIEAHLAEAPDDGRGFALIAPIYVRMGRFDDAAKAYAAALRILGETAGRRAALGQARVMASDGVVTAEARADFEKALADDPNSAQARYFLATAAEQDGRKDQAVAMWRALEATSPADAPWLGGVRQRLAALTGQPESTGVGPQPGDAAAAAGTLPDGAPAGPAAASIAALAPDQQRAAIQGMVDGLATRLAQNGRDPEGWLRLVKAYTVLGQQDKARQALADARKVLDRDAASLTRLGDLAKQLGLEG